MMNKFVKYLLIFTTLFLFVIASFISLNSEFRRYLFSRIVSAYKLYQITAIQPYLKKDDIKGASIKLLEYIEISEKWANGKSILLMNLYDIAKLIETKSVSEEDYSHLEKVFTKLVEQDPSLYEAQVWLAKSYSFYNTELALEHIDKAIEISAAQEDAYRVALEIAKKKEDQNLANFYCSKYKNSKFGGKLPRYTKSFFEGNIITKMALEFTTDENSKNFYTHSGLQLNNYDNYEFSPIKPIDINGFKIYLSSLPGVKISFSEILIISSKNSDVISVKEVFATSKSAYIDDNSDNTLSFLLMNEGDEILSINFKNTIKSLNKIVLKMKISKLDLANNALCN